jgi:hypothetical protein
MLIPSRVPEEKVRLIVNDPVDNELDRQDDRPDPSSNYPSEAIHSLICQLITRFAGVISSAVLANPPLPLDPVKAGMSKAWLWLAEIPPVLPET